MIRWLCLVLLLHLPTTLLADEIDEIELDDAVELVYARSASSYSAGNEWNIAVDPVLDSGKTLGQLLAEIPGLEVSHGGDSLARSTVRIRGGDEHQVLFIIDGVQMNNGEASQPSQSSGIAFDLSSIAVDQIDTIKVIRSDKSAEYGSEASSGVVIITTKRPTENKFEFNQIASSNLLKIALGYSFVQPQLTLQLSYAKSDGNYVIPDPFNQNFADISGADSIARCIPKYSDGYRLKRCNSSDLISFNLKLQSDIQQLSMQVQQGRRWGLGGINSVQPYGVVRWLQLGFGYMLNHAIGDHTLELSTEYSIKNSYRNENTQLNQDSLISTQQSARGAFGVDYWFWLLDAHKFSLGIDLENLSISSKYVAETRRQIALKSGYSFASTGWLASVNIYQSFLQHIDPPLAYSLEAGYALDWVGVKLSHTKGYRLPSLHELYGTNTDYAPSMANPNLQPEHSLGVDLGLFIDIDNRLHAEINYFYNWVNNKIIALPEGNNYSFYKLKNIYKTISSGWELALRLNITQHVLWRISFTDNKAIIDQYEAQDPRYNGRRLPDRARYQLNSALKLRYGFFSSEINARYKSLRFLDLSNYKHLKPYVAVDLSLNYHPAEQFSLGLHINNVGNTVYSEQDNYPAPGREVLFKLRIEI